jgi:phosphatidate cytidylyltransferase
MAFNLQTFKTRALTAVIFAAIMLGGLLWNHWSFLILFTIVHFGCWWEYLKLTEKIQQTVFHPYTKMGWMVLGYGLMLWFCSTSYQLGGYGITANFSLPVSAAGFALLLLGIFQKNPVKPKAFGMAALGIVYISLCWGLILHINQGLLEPNPDILNGVEGKTVVAEELTFSAFYNSKGPLLVLLLVLTMWVNDTMAYIVGSFIGKTPLSKISPKKTWEGTIGGILLASLLMGWLGFYFIDGLFTNSQTIYSWILFCLTAAIAGTAGDLLESKLKRMANVKDSGSIMPGHGGFLDRFDSLLLATPLIWLFIRLFFTD